MKAKALGRAGRRTYALQPMVEAARAGPGPLSSAALHAIATALFAIRLALVAALAWRLTAPPA